MDEPFITAPFYPPSVLVKGLIVNKLGERFVAEDSYHARTSYHVMAQPRLRGVPHRRQRAHRAPEDAAGAVHRRLGDGRGDGGRARACPTGSLAKTLDRYNEHAARGEDPDFHKHPDWLAPQDTGPWGAYDLTLGKALYAGFTLGGLRVTVDGQVQRADGSVVPGLYAAGACASNLAQDGAGYCSGTQLGEGSFFGRRAGRHAAGVTG